VTRLWKAFVLGWLLVPMVGASFLVVSAQLPAGRLAVDLLMIAGLAVLYLRLTLKEPLGPGDLDPGGPSTPELRRRFVTLALMSLLVGGVAAREPANESWWMAQNVVVAAGVALPSPLALWAIGVVTGLTGLGTWYLTGRPVPVTLILLVFGASAIAVRQLTINVAQLRAARDELARAAVDQERLRFARDLHDLLGHTLSLVVLKSELAGRLIATSPERAAAEIHDVEQSARDALRQVRTAVAGYRQRVLARELDAALEILGAAGIEGVVEDALRQGSGQPLPPALDRLFAWAVREGVTNVVRHSGARRCEIRLSRQSNRVELSVTDNGNGGQLHHTHQGSGLTGLAERAREHAASMSAGRLPDGGFRLLVVASDAANQPTPASRT
jgi:two-component system, NarL family, sensor histidine kinase DesK